MLGCAGMIVYVDNDYNLLARARIRRDGQTIAKAIEANLDSVT